MIIIIVLTDIFCYLPSIFLSTSHLMFITHKWEFIDFWWHPITHLFVLRVVSYFAGAILFSTEDICILSCLQPSCFTSFYFLIFHPLVILLTPYSAPLSPFQVRVSRLITLKWGNSFCKKFPIRLTWQLWDACYKADAICWGGNWTRQCSLSQKRRCNLVSNQSSAVVIGQ